LVVTYLKVYLSSLCHLLYEKSTSDR
jgi:hypothetical protein